MFKKVLSIFQPFINFFNPNVDGIIGQIGKRMFIDAIEKYKGIRRTILIIVVYLNVHAFFTTVNFMWEHGHVDPNWTNIFLALIGLLTVFITFYTTSRTKEHIVEEQCHIEERKHIEEKSLMDKAQDLLNK